jgi:triphosphoribosyl-dephospho-CoA synthase
MSVEKRSAEYCARAYQAACMAELQALKPGNVHVFADGHGMTIAHFIKSTDATSATVANCELSIGERILESVRATQQVVGQNTNLGLLLLCVPLIAAAMQQQHGQSLENSLNEVLEKSTLVDAVTVAQAIVLASPAGLGQVKQSDVHATPTITLLEMMKLAQFRDRIAWNYANQFTDVLWFGVHRYRDAMLRWDNAAWATTALYLGFLSGQPDTHIVRKYGEAVASVVMQEAADYELKYWQIDNPKLVQKSMLDWDKSLKQRGINPGTSADLVVATLLADNLLKIV